MKKLAVVLAALMMLSCSTVFMAAESVDTTVKSETTGVTINQSAMDTIPPQYVAQFSEAALEKTGEEDASVVAITFLKGTVPTDGKVILSDVNGLKDGDSIKVFHLYEEASNDDSINGTWVERPAKVVNGQVVIDFTGAAHFSPIVIVKLADEVVAEEAPVADNSIYYLLANPFGAASSAATLPKTGAVAVLPVAAMACLAGAVVCGRKEK